MKCHWLRDQRGSVLLFTTVLIVFLLVMGGIAIDLTYLGAAKGELQRSMDAASLAGAGNLGFDDTVFPTVRQEAWRFGDLNPYRVGTINLNLNAANAANGDIVLGIWDADAGSFSPSLDGTRVNAVQCQYATQIPTSFLRLLGFNTLPVAATATAWSPPPAQPSECPFPVGLSGCFFDSGGDPNTSVGCGAAVTFITSSQQSQLGANTAGWVDLTPGANNVNSQTTAQAVDDAASGNCGDPEDYVQTGEDVPTGGGQFQNVFSGHIKPAFQDIYANSPSYEVKNASGDTVYEGKGWKVAVPVIDTGSECPPGSQINQSNRVVGWTSMVITQVLDVGGECAVANYFDDGSGSNPWDPRCLVTKNGTAQSLQDPNVHAGNRAIFGYYECEYSPSPPASISGPIAARPRPKLVQ